MKFKEYEILAARTYPKGKTTQDNLSNFALGISGESGEVADLIKKALHHAHDLNKFEVEKEVGDILWYLSMLSKEIGTDLETIAGKNIEKLEGRYPDGFSEEASRNREEDGLSESEVNFIKGR